MTAADQVIAYAHDELGKPYVWGDEGPNTFDCSGLMQWIFAKVGVVLPRTSQEQQAWATPVKTPAAGDMVFWGRPATHVALYIGGGKVIAAPYAGATVRIEDIANNTPTSYGRPPGLAWAIAGGINALTNPVTSKVGDWLAGGRHIALEAAFVAAGIGLLGWGIWQAIGRQTVSKVKGVIS